MKTANRMRGRRNKATGKVAESHALWALVRAGVLEVEHIQTGWTVQRGAVRDEGGAIVGTTIRGARPAAKVSGDFTGLLRGGRAVICEVKKRQASEPDEARNIRWSDLQPHQRDTLTRRAELGALSLFAWVTFDPVGECLLLEWAKLLALGFGPRSSITVEQARALHIGPGKLLPCSHTPPARPGQEGRS